MTPANPDALADARDLVRHSLKNGAPGLTETAREAVVRSTMLKLESKVLAPILAAKEAAEARAAQLQAEVEALKGALKPFADEADRYDPPENDDDQPLWDVRGSALCLRDLRAARAATAREG